MYFGFCAVLLDFIRFWAILYFGDLGVFYCILLLNCYFIMFWWCLGVCLAGWFVVDCVLIFVDFLMSFVTLGILGLLFCCWNWLFCGDLILVWVLFVFALEYRLCVWYKTGIWIFCLGFDCLFFVLLVLSCLCLCRLLGLYLCWLASYTFDGVD